MADQLFNDSVMQLVLQFSNPQKRDIQDADKLVAHLDAGLRDIVKDAITAGKSIGDLSKEVQQLQTNLISLQRNSGKAGVDPAIVKSARDLLRNYTPERIQDVGRITAMRSDAGVESSTTYALKSGLEKVAKELELARRRDATNQGQFYRATGSSPIGRGLFVDTETAFDPNRRQGVAYRQDEEFRYAATAMRQQLVEVTATLFAFNKQTGEILNAQERVYHGFQDLEYQSRSLRLPSGLTPQMLRGQAISPLAIASMARRADFFVAHNAPFDKNVMSRYVPQLASMPTLDTMRGIPWRDLGYQSRALQDLLRAHAIDPGQAHRSGSDVQAAIQLLGRSSPLGGPNYMSMLLGNQGPLTRSQDLLATIRSQAMETKNQLIRQLGEAPRYGYASQTINRRNFAALSSTDESTILASIIESIQGGPTVRGISGSGGTPEATPQNIGAAALALGRRLGTTNEFLRNQAVMSGPAASEKLLAIIAGQSSFQEGVQQYGGSREGRRFRTNQDIRSGEDLIFAMMRGTNTQLRNQRLAIEGGYPSSGGLGENRNPNFYDWAAHHANNMLSQEWAQGRTMGGPPIQRAAQLANALPQGDTRRQRLLDIVYSQQQKNRDERDNSFAESEFPRRRTTGRFGSQRGSFNLGGLYDSIFGSSAATPGRDPIAELKSMRREDSIARLYSSANKAADALEQYANIIAPQKMKAANDKLAAAQQKAADKLTQDVGKTDEREMAGRSRLQSRIDALGLRSSSIGSNFENTGAQLSLRELQAESKYRRQKTIVDARTADLKTSEDYLSANPAARRAMEAKLQATLQPSQTGYRLASYRRAAFEAKSPEELAEIRKQYAGALTKDLGFSADRYQEVFEALPGARGGAMGTEAEQSRIKAQQAEIESRREAISQAAQKRRAQINSDFAAGRIRNEADRDSRLGAVGQEYQTRMNNLADRAYSARSAEARRRQRFSLEDEAAGGGGGGRGSRGGGGGGFGGRGGLDFGLGLAAFAGAAVALREMTLESAQYAARTQQLKVVTEQMAKTNFVAVDSISAYVTAMKGQNQTTQSAYSTIQRMIQAQFDIAKAPALGRAAQNLSTLTGTDPAETLDRIMMGLVTGYTRQLHMAGLQVSRLSVNRNLRGELGREPNEFEQRQGLFNAVLTESARTAGTYEQSLTTAAGQMARLNVQAQETKNTLGNQFLPVYERAIHLVNDGLRTVQNNPTGASRLISGGIAGATGLGAIGTLATGAWAAGAIRGGLSSLGPWGSAAALALGAATTYGTYRTLTQDPTQLKAASARDAVADIARGRASLMDATPLGARPTEDARKQFDFEHKMFVESEKGYADSRISIQRNLTTELAQIYMQQAKDFQDFSDKANFKQGIGGYLLGAGTGLINFLTTGKYAGAGTTSKGPFSEPTMADPKVIDLGGGVVISPEDQKKAIARVRQQVSESLHPSAKASYDALRVAQAISTVNQAETELDTLDRGYQPGGKDIRATRRARNADNPLGLIQSDLADRKARLQQDLDNAEKVLKEEQAKGTGGMDLSGPIAKVGEVRAGRDDEIKKMEREANEQAAALYRKRDQQLRANDASVSVARIRASVIPGNYASEEAASLLVRSREEQRARADFASHLNPIQRDLELDAARKQAEQEAISRRERQTNAARQRQETTVLAGGQFAAQQAMNDPRLSVQEALIKGYNAEMEATKQLSNDEDRRNQQLQLQLRLRTALVEASRREAAENAEFNIAVRGNQVGLQETVARILGGRGTRSQDDLAMEAIERRRQLEIGQAQFAFGERSSTGGAEEQNKLRNERDEAINRANTQAAEARLEQMDRVVQVRRQELGDVYQRQGAAVEQIGGLQANGPAEEIANIQNVHQMRLELIDKEFAARGKTLDAEKQRTKEILDTELTYTERIMEMQKEKYQEARNVSGSIFNAIADRGNPRAFPDLIKGFVLSQGKTIFENATAPFVKNVFAGAAGNFGNQFTTDASGKQVPTALGRLLGGSVFGAIPRADASAVLAGVQKETISAETALKQSIDRLDDTIKSITPGGLGSVGGGGGGSFGASGSGGLFGSAASLLGGGSVYTARAMAAMNPAAQMLFGGRQPTESVSSTFRPGSPVSDLMGGMSLLGGLGPLFGGSSSSGPNIAAPDIGDLGPGGSPNLGFPPGTVADYAGIAAPPGMLQGSVPIQMAASSNGNGLLIDGKMLQDGNLVEPPSGRNVVNGYVQPGPTAGKNISDFLGAFGSNLGHSDLKGVFTGHSDIPGTEPGTAEMEQNKAQRIGGAAAAGAKVLGGVEVANSGFHRGGAKGTIEGISGVLAAASVVPGPQQPFVAAAAATAALVASMIPDPKEIRRAQIDQWMQQNTYRAPVALDATIAASGGSLVSEGMNGLATNTGISAFPFNVRDNQLMAQSNPGAISGFFGGRKTNTLYPYAQGYNFLPGSQLAPNDVMASGVYGSGMGFGSAPMYGSSNPNYISPSAMASRPSAPAPTNITINLPVSAMDSQDVMRRSPDIAAAVSKELRNGGGASDLNYYINQSVFGGG